MNVLNDYFVTSILLFWSLTETFITTCTLIILFSCTNKITSSKLLAVNDLHNFLHTFYKNFFSSFEFLFFKKLHNILILSSFFRYFKYFFLYIRSWGDKLNMNETKKNRRSRNNTRNIYRPPFYSRFKAVLATKQLLGGSKVWFHFQCCFMEFFQLPRLIHGIWIYVLETHVSVVNEIERI